MASLAGRVPLDVRPGVRRRGWPRLRGAGAAPYLLGGVLATAVLASLCRPHPRAQRRLLAARHPLTERTLP